MNRKSIQIYEGRTLEEEERLSLRQICERCHIEEDMIVELVEEGILDPLGNSRMSWKFRFTATERVKRVVRLQRDFELNLPAVALILQLLDRIEQLETRVRY
jgi:chaperone modulatory protein CbpM